MDVGDNIALAAAAISFLSMALAGKSYSVSQKALRLAEAEHFEKKLPIIPYLIDSFTFSQNNVKYCSFAISYTNQSSSPQSFREIELEVEFVDEEDTIGKAIAPPAEDVSPLGIKEGYKHIKTPLNIPPKETVSGWITFKVPSISYRKLRIELYKVIGKTTDGKTSEVESCLLRHVANDK